MGQSDYIFMLRAICGYLCVNCLLVSLGIHMLQHNIFTSFLLGLLTYWYANCKHFFSVCYLRFCFLHGALPHTSLLFMLSILSICPPVVFGFEATKET